MPTALVVNRFAKGLVEKLTQKGLAPESIVSIFAVVKLVVASAVGLG